LVIQKVLLLLNPDNKKKMKYIIQLEDGKLIENFFKNGFCQTDDIQKAGKYSKIIATKRIENLKIKATLIKATN
jgi:hypothetical protein